MKKIGVVTYWNSLDNYGQVLQCYALQRYLIDKGFDAFLIRYNPQTKDSFINKIIRNLSIKRICYFFSKERREKKEIERLSSIENDQVRKLSLQCRFDDFRRDNIIYTDTIYNSIYELRATPPKADVYICGSDQVWNNSLYDKNTAGWFLHFGNARRVSYAASIGRDLNEKELSLFSKYIDLFDFVSVRESSALDVCLKVGRKDSCITIDPTLLYGKKTYESLIDIKELNKKKKYIFIYSLNIDDPEKIHFSEIKKIASEKQLAIKVCSSSGYVIARNYIPGYNNLHLTVEQWLKTILCSEFVVTSSFHGTVFCLLMHVQFVCIPLEGPFKRANDRILTLLKMVGLEYRLLNNKNNINSIVNKVIDWDFVEKKIENMRVKSSEFLEEALYGL